MKSEQVAGMKSEQVAGFILECMAGFVGIRKRAPRKRSFVIRVTLIWLDW